MLSGLLANSRGRTGHRGWGARPLGYALAKRTQPSAADRRRFLQSRPDPGHHAGRAHALDLHFVAAPDKVAAAERLEEEHGQKAIAHQPVERMEEPPGPLRPPAHPHPPPTPRLPPP